MQTEVLAPLAEANVMISHMDHRPLAGSCCRRRIQWVSWDRLYTVLSREREPDTVTLLLVWDSMAAAS